MAALVAWTPAFGDEHDCAQLRQLLIKFRSNPVDLKGDRLTNDETRSTVSISGSHECTYEERKTSTWVTCYWIAKTYAAGSEVFTTLNNIVGQCKFVQSISRRPDEANGEQASDVEFDSDLTAHTGLDMTIEHNTATMFPDLGAREIEMILSVRRRAGN